MGYALALGTCVGCHQPFHFNPMRVPSVRVNGAREPVCLACMAKVNAQRQQEGQAPWYIHPDAYEACAEDELE